MAAKRKVNGWKCICGSIFTTRQEKSNHIKESGHVKSSANNRIIANCQYCKKEIYTMSALKIHEKHCWENPNRTPGKSRNMKPFAEKISKGITKAFDEGRHGDTGWTIHKRHEKTYPEQWLESVIKDRFNDQQFHSELRIGIYKMDFAWPHKKRCIEIDGEQHYIDEAQIKRDRRKEKCLEFNGWTYIRLRWRDVQKEKEKYIQIAKKFIEA